MDVDEEIADAYQQTLREAVPQFREIGVNLFIFDGLSYYDDPRNMTSHTIIATPAVWVDFEEHKQSVAGWLWNVIEGKPKAYGLELVDKEYD